MTRLFAATLLPQALSTSKIVTIVLGIVAIVCLDLVSRTRHKKSHFAFGAILGTVLGLGLIEAAQILLHPNMHQNGAMLGLGVLLMIVVWRLLFGTWEAHTKATVLGTFLFWIIFNMLFSESPEQRLPHLIAIAVAVIPVVVWCGIFLPYHRERLSVIFCLFFAGMLSTAPILFYDALVRRGITLDFLLFKIETQSFSRSAHLLVDDLWPALSQVGASLSSTFIAFLIVGVIEEGSKFWVLRRAGGQFATSIADLMQMAILVALGFAFAENVTTTGYFVGFVKEFLFRPEGADWIGFLGNVTGRSVLTTMVHIVSTGVLGYFLGLAVFAGPILKNQAATSINRRILQYFHVIFGMREDAIFRRQMLTVGFLSAALLHALSNFMVTLPDILPGNPRTFGDLLGSPAGSPLHSIALLLVPTLLYVVGGFALLSALFGRSENRKERGHVIPAEMFVTEEEGM